MRSHKRPLMGRIYRAYKAFFQPLSREILPLSSGIPVKPGEARKISGRMQIGEGFLPNRLTISNAGTAGGAADWIVNDIRINDASQFCQAGDVPGDLFKPDAISSSVRFDVVKGGADVDLIVTYIGKNEVGCPFFGALSGMEYDPGLLEIARAALLRTLPSASRRSSK